MFRFFVSIALEVKCLQPDRVMAMDSQLYVRSAAVFLEPNREAPGLQCGARLLLWVMHHGASRNAS